MSDEAPRLSVLPPNRSLLEAGLDLAFDKLLERIQPPFPALMDPQTTPAAFLPYLAADRGVTDWNPEAPESERRATTALAWAIKRQAGTRRALIHAVESMELAAKVTSWHELKPAGVPYSFTVEATVERPWLIGDFPRLWRRLNDAKSERDNLELVLVHETSGGLRAAAAAGTPMAIGDLELDGALPDIDLQGSLGAVTGAREFNINDYDLEAPTT
ncbi:phage tail protein I [Pseudomonas aeruginosa]|nr:phage tail protein I [Pseudomonas aeruginosa]